ncbi:hypothetical protein BRO54_1085 [Geobacillus proteiniphilus]|uniref:Uncharacterized protein n=1 Tax=Geobacillus proteiniphilus TaxID=860353 RepID=A0A1Q5T4X8_9BACL|nr:hypothetical protein BRO54_1085 [Geobacillus proteiniphilus]
MKMTNPGTRIFTEESHGQRFALHPGMKMTHQDACIFTETSSLENFLSKEQLQDISH